MLDQRAQQYYLNAMGLPLWQLRSHDQLIDGAYHYIPAGIANTGLAETKIKPEQPIVAAKIQAQVQTETEQAKTHHTEIKTAELLKAAKSNFDPERDKTNKLVSPDPNISQNKKVITQQFQSIATDFTMSKNPLAVLDSQPWFQLLSQQISSCSLCPARTGGAQSLTIQQIKSAQNSTKNILLLVETPSAREYLQSHYLTKEYQSLLESIFYALKLDANIYISSIIKCSSIVPYQSGDKERFNQESNYCLAFLKQELDNLNPDLIVTLGPVKIEHLVEEVSAEMTLEQLSNQSFQVKKSIIKEQVIPLLATFHPAFLYRNPLFKAKALQHWINIVNLLKEQASDTGTNRK